MGPWADVGNSATLLKRRRRYDSFDELIKGGMSGAEASTEFASVPVLGSVFVFVDGDEWTCVVRTSLDLRYALPDMGQSQWWWVLVGPAGV